MGQGAISGDVLLYAIPAAPLKTMQGCRVQINSSSSTWLLGSEFETAVLMKPLESGMVLCETPEPFNQTLGWNLVHWITLPLPHLLAIILVRTMSAAMRDAGMGI